MIQKLVYVINKMCKYALLVAAVGFIAHALIVVRRGKPYRAIAGQDMITAQADSVFLVFAGDGHGSGFFVEDDGKIYVATAGHVCGDLKIGEPIIIKHDYKSPEIPALIVARDHEHDLCIAYSLLLDAAVDNPLFGGGYIETHVLSLANKLPSKFDATYTIGFPNFDAETYERGVFLGHNPSTMHDATITKDACELITGAHWVIPLFPNPFLPPEMNKPACLFSEDTYEATTRVFPGASGSPIFDQFGDVIGVLSQYDEDTHHAYFIPVKYLSRLLGEL